MEPSLAVAMIAGAFSVLAMATSAVAAGRVARANDQAAARRSYEFEARKRLYSEVEPLLFQLEMAAVDGFDRIANIARAEREQKLGRGGNSWLGRRGYYFTSRIYGILLPCAISRLVTEKIASVDLALDRQMAASVAVLREYEKALSADFRLARQAPAIDYDPDDSSELPTSVGGAMRQGLVAGRLESCVEALVVRKPGSPPRAMLFGEFERALQDEQVASQVEPLARIVEGFSAAERPVFWRVLLLKAILLRLIAGLLLRRGKRTNLQREVSKLAKQREFRSSLSASPDAASEDPSLEATFSTALQIAKRIESSSRL